MNGWTVDLIYRPIAECKKGIGLEPRNPLLLVLAASRRAMFVMHADCGLANRGNHDPLLLARRYRVHFLTRRAGSRSSVLE